MRRSVASAAVAVAAALGAAVASAGPAYAYPATSFGRYEIPGGATAGSVTWYNESVGVQGYVVDSAVVADSSTVIFDFWQSSTYLDTQTRTADGTTTSFNFTEAGPQGGITKVVITLCPTSYAGNLDLCTGDVLLR